MKNQSTPRNYEGPWQHALSLLQAMQARRLQLGEINVGSAVQACLAVTLQQPVGHPKWWWFSKGIPAKMAKMANPYKDF